MMKVLRRIMNFSIKNGMDKIKIILPMLTQWLKSKLSLCILVLLLSSCYGTYYISDAEYSDLREEHASLTYYNGDIYWGWHSGYYYYYGKPHYYPWYYYYNACPPNHYHTTTHVIITRPVNKPTHRPNWNRPNNRPNTNVIVKPNKPNKNITVKPNRTNIKVNKNKTNIKVNKNKNNKKVINRRRPK